VPAFQHNDALQLIAKEWKAHQAATARRRWRVFTWGALVVVTLVGLGALFCQHSFQRCDDAALISEFLAEKYGLLDTPKSAWQRGESSLLSAARLKAQRLCTSLLDTHPGRQLAQDQG